MMIDREQSQNVSMVGSATAASPHNLNGENAMPDGMISSSYASTLTTPAYPRAHAIPAFVSAPLNWWNDERLSQAVQLEAEYRQWANSACLRAGSSEEFDAITRPLCNLTDAIMRAPVQGVLGARAKLRFLQTDDWDARLRTDFDVCMQSLLDGLERAQSVAQS